MASRTVQEFASLEAREHFEEMMNERTDTRLAIANAGRNEYGGNDYHPYINF